MKNENLGGAMQKGHPLGPPCASMQNRYLNNVNNFKICVSLTCVYYNVDHNIRTK